MKQRLQLDPFALQKRIYRHESKSIVATEKMMMKNSLVQVLAKEYVQEDPYSTGHIFDVKTLHQESGKDNAIKTVSDDMASLITDITVGTDDKGHLRKIYNMHEVKHRWKTVQKQWKKRAAKKEREQVAKTIAIVEDNLNNGSFEGDISNQGGLYFLFPGLFGDYPEEGREKQRDLNKFLITQPLPLRIRYQWITDPGQPKKIILEGSGEVDEDRLDKQTLVRFIRSLKDRVDLKVDLQVAYKERFAFDRFHWLEKAEQKVKVKIPGFYISETQQQIEQTTEHGQ